MLGQQWQDAGRINGLIVAPDSEIFFVKMRWDEAGSVH